MNKKISFLSSITYKDVVLYGGKGASLGELKQIGINVPDAFVISTEINSKNIADIKGDILKSFLELKVKYVAIRSSATTEDSVDDSFAGQFDTFLNITKKDLLKNILKCYKSLNSERVLSYCKSKKINPSKIKIAVIVQKMVQSEISGVAFSVNPISGNLNEIMIEAGFGLGEYVVSGIITPDKYLFDKKTRKILEKKINYQEYKLLNSKGLNKKMEVPLEKRNAQKLLSKYFPELLRSIVKIEKKYKKPVDIEWAIKNNILYITQARFITTLYK